MKLLQGDVVTFFASTGARARAVRALRSALATLGLPGALGAVLCMCCALVEWVQMPAAERRQQSLQAAVDQARLQALRRAAGAAAALPAAGASATPLQRYALLFPEAATRVARLDSLLTRAARHGLKLQGSDYRYSVQPLLGLGAYRVHLPAQAPYAALQAFWADALRLDAALSLDSLVLQRDKPEDELLRAELVFTLHVRDSAAAPAGAEKSGARP